MTPPGPGAGLADRLVAVAGDLPIGAVARAAGVLRSDVERVLAGRPGVAPAALGALDVWVRSLPPF